MAVRGRRAAEWAVHAFPPTDLLYVIRDFLPRIKKCLVSVQSDRGARTSFGASCVIPSIEMSEYLRRAFGNAKARPALSHRVGQANTFRGGEAKCPTGELFVGRRYAA